MPDFRHSAARHAIAGVALAALAAGPAAAQHMVTRGPVPGDDPLMADSQLYQPRDQFTLWNDQDMEVVHFRQPHLLSICDPHGRPDAIGDASHGIPIMITWEGGSATVSPGSCFAFDAARAKVRPAGPIPRNDDLVGTVRVIR